MRSISDDDIFFNDIYNDARVEAVNDFLYSKLSIRIGEVVVTKTKMSKNPYSSILWVTLSKELDVTKIFRRSAQLKTRHIRIMTFFPSSIWPRKMSVEKNLFEARKSNRALKYQIRLGMNDIQLFIKDDKLPVWTRVDLDRYGPVVDLIDDNMKINDTDNKHDDSAITKKRKDITPLKNDAKKNKDEDNESVENDNDSMKTINVDNVTELTAES